MTAPSPAPIIDAPPRQAICRSPKDATQPCRFAGTCHESRQRLMHYEGLRGRRCWAYQQGINRLRHGAEGPGSGAVLCFNCGADYSRDYWLGSHRDPHVCPDCLRKDKR